MYEVGGRIRDQFLGLKSKDVDYSVVIESHMSSIEKGLWDFQAQLVSEGFEIFLVTPECFTIRAKFPKNHKYSGVADFVLARKEIGYTEGTRTPICVLGTLEDDLMRRDFTVNAMAKDENGDIIDLFNGKADIYFRILDTPTDPMKSFNDDPLRIIRAMRFAVTKGFVLSERVKLAIKELGVQGLEKVSVERVRDELYKCLKHDTRATLRYLDFLRDDLNFDLEKYAFEGTGLWLEPTNKG